MSNIQLGAIVMTPVTDSEGEVSFVYGTLVDINSRFAKVSVEGDVIRVGKSKIELVSNPGTEKFCPKCNGATVHEFGEFEDHDIEDWTHEFHCLKCGHDFGKELDKAKATKAMSNKLSERNYENCIAASGRRSKDNGDLVARELRGKPLDEVYKKAAEYLEVEESVLRARYCHLNVGQQRMCLGNRIRSVKL